MRRRFSLRPRNWFSAWRPWLLLAVLLGAWFAAERYWIIVPEPPRGTPIAVSTTFHRCGQGQVRGRGPNCVFDGDTFFMGTRHIRIIGIDAPEIAAHARCPEEARLAEEAAAELIRLLNAGPFTLQAPDDGLRDGYGRELMAVTRTGADGAAQDIAAALVASGKVREYTRGPRETWCAMPS